MLKHNDECDPYTHVTVQPVAVLEPEEFDEFEAFRTMKVTAKPLYLKYEKLDLYCYPELYPTGCGGTYSEREVIVKPPKFLKQRFHYRDPRFRRNIQYLFFEHGRYDDRAIEHGMYAVMKTSNSCITAPTLFEKWMKKTNN